MICGLYLIIRYQFVQLGCWHKSVNLRLTVSSVLCGPFGHTVALKLPNYRGFCRELRWTVINNYHFHSPTGRVGRPPVKVPSRTSLQALSSSYRGKGQSYTAWTKTCPVSGYGSPKVTGANLVDLLQTPAPLPSFWVCMPEENQIFLYVNLNTVKNSRTLYPRCPCSAW